MSTISEYTFRQVIPRLSTFRTAIAYQDPALVGKPTFPIKDGDYERKKQNWPKSKTLFFATDLVGSALIFNDHNDPNVIDAARFVCAAPNANDLAIEAASRLLQLPESSKQVDVFNIETIRATISAYKVKLKSSPLDPLRWCDIAFYYAILSQDEKAEKAMLTAVALSDHSYVLRSAARLFFHLNQPDKALHLLRKSTNLRQDPLLASCEIAISDVFDLPTKLFKAGKSMLADSSFTPSQLGELATVLGSLEFKSGSVKPGKKYFQQALIQPNENIAAQAEWIAPRFNVKFKLPSLEEIPANYEATMNRARIERNFEKVVESAEKWLSYQPFSSMPAIAGSFTASVCLRDFGRAISIARKGLQSSPDEFMLKNNLAFAYANSEQTDIALEVFSTIDPSSLSERELFTYRATKGLLSYRTGDVEAGRKLYKDAIEGFESSGAQDAKAIALLFLGLEEARIDRSRSGAFITESKQLAERLNIPELLSIPEFIQK